MTPADASRPPTNTALDAVVEAIARNAHDAWVRSHRAVRPDRAGALPEFLVPFDALPEVEQEYERALASQEVANILAAGCRVELPNGTSIPEPESRGTQRALNSDELGLTSSADDRPVSELLELWRRHDAETWSAHPALHRILAERLLHFGHPMAAQEVLAEGLSRAATDPRLRYLQALALARLGLAGRAQEILLELSRERLSDDPKLSVDVFSGLGRTEKDLAAAAEEPAERRRLLESALTAYRNALGRAPDGYKSYPAINAATVAMLLGSREHALELAATARANALTELRSLGGGEIRPEQFWPLATLGEAALIAGDLREAERWYSEASQQTRADYGNIASARRQARLLAKHLGVERAWIDNLLKVPSVVVFAGHMIDRPDRSLPRFPPALEQDVSKAIGDRLQALGAGFGFAGAACGSDILFLEAMESRGGETHVVLPFARDRFCTTSVGVVPSGNWIARFDEALRRATTVQEASGAPSEWGGVVFEYANLLMQGSAALRSRELDVDVTGLAVWDGRPGDGVGGTASTVAAWRQRAMRIELISPDSLRSTASSSNRS